MDGIITFITITLLIIIVPGPDFLIVMKNNPFGQTKWFYGALGITSAHIIYSSLAVLGLYIFLQVYITYFDYKNTRCMLSDLSWRTKYSFARQSMNFNTGGIKVNDVSCFTYHIDKAF